MSRSSSKSMKIPESEEILVRYYNRSGSLLYVMTSNYFRSEFTLYEMQENGHKKVESGLSPLSLEEKYKVYEAMTRE